MPVVRIGENSTDDFARNLSTRLDEWLGEGLHADVGDSCDREARDCGAGGLGDGRDLYGDYF